MPKEYRQKLLPPMTALKSFEAAARMNSFTLAADELNVTQGAISRQIKLLEGILNVTLFDRRNQQVILTEAGRYYAQHVADSLDYLKSAATQTIAFAQPGNQLHIGIVPAFGSRWIIPRLKGFAIEYPHVHLRLSTISGGDFEFALDEFDVALVVGVGDWPKAIVHPLAKEELVGVAAPQWIEKFNIRAPSDLIGPPLLVHTDRPTLWSKWFEINDIDAGALVPAPLALEQIVMIIEAANAQLGAALLPRALIGRELESGELQVIEGEPLYVNDGFHVVYASHKKQYAPLVAFRDWLLEAR